MPIVKGHGGLINDFLSWGCFTPLARLSYCIYLIHYTILFWGSSFTSYTISYSNLTTVYLSLATLAISVGVALVLVIAFEAPILHLEKIIFGLLGLRKTSHEKKSKLVSATPTSTENDAPPFYKDVDNSRK